MKIKSILALFIIISLSFSQINIIGKVTDSTGIVPIAGAAVKLKEFGLVSVSKTDGSFILAGTKIVENQ